MRALGNINDLAKVDGDYACVMEPVPPIILKSETHVIPGRLVWAYVPNGNELEKTIVFVADDELPVDQRVIENFSGRVIK